MEVIMLRTLLVTCGVVFLLAACGDDAGQTTTAVPGQSTTTAAPATTIGTTTSEPAVTSTTAATTTEATSTTTTLPTQEGEPYDLWVPVSDEGPILGVIGVRHDDTLNVRTGPGVDHDVMATLDPTLDGITGTGEGWQLPGGAVWWAIQVGGGVGWANQQFLSRLSAVDDVTSEIVARVGEIPVAETMLDLGTIAADAYAGFDVADNVVITVAPTVGDLGEITLDVVGIGDDTQGGFRLHVFGQPTDGGEGFSLMAVEATHFCQRGVDGEGRCV